MPQRRRPGDPTKINRHTIPILIDQIQRLQLPNAPHSTSRPVAAASDLNEMATDFNARHRTNGEKSTSPRRYSNSNASNSGSSANSPNSGSTTA